MRNNDATNSREEEVKRLRNEIAVLKNRQNKLSNSRDDTDQEDQTTQLKESEANLHALINNRDDSIWSIDNQYHFVILNDIFKRDYRDAYDVELQAGDYAFAGLDKQTIHFWKSKYDLALSGEKVVFEFNAPIHGEMHYYEVSLSPIKKDNEYCGVSCLSIDKTKAKITQKKLMENEQRYQNIFKNNPVPLWEEDFSELWLYISHLQEKYRTNIGSILDEHTDEVQKCVEKLKVIDVNNAGVKLHHATDKDQLLNNIQQIFTKKSLQVFKKEIIAIANGDTSFVSEGEIKTFDGQHKYISIYLIIDQRVKKAIIATPDISAKKDVENQLKMLSDALTQSPNIVIMTDLQGRITYINDKFTEVTGYSMDEAYQKKPNILSSGSHSKTFFKHLWKTIIAGEDWRGEIYNKRKDGTFYWEAAHVFPVQDIEGNTTHYIKESEDITERKKKDEQLQQQTRDLQLKNYELDAFSHTVAHDLKNPIGTIIGFTEILKEDLNETSKEDIKAFIEAMNRSAKKSNDIINSLLFFAGVSETDIELEKINLKLILREALERLSPMIQDYKSTISYPEKWPAAYGKPQWVEEILVNYISNAIKYGAYPPVIEIGYEELKNDATKMLKIWVKDNGPGISKGDQDLIFGKFERLKKINIEGHGLGLSIVKRITEKLGGKVGVNSTLGEGSIFYFTLPVEKEE
jgi:PAS domain S-box-containing protein